MIHGQGLRENFCAMPVEEPAELPKMIHLGLWFTPFGF